MGTYKDRLEETIRDYEKTLPEELGGEVDPRELTINKEVTRGMLIIDILQYSLEFMDNPVGDYAEINLVNAVTKALKYHSERGGAGSETFTRLIALGVIEDMPEVFIENSTRYVSMEESQTRIDGQVLDLYVVYNANLPDEWGNEMCFDMVSRGNVCSVEIRLNLGDRHFVSEHLRGLREEYGELMGIMYPEQQAYLDSVQPGTK